MDELALATIEQDLLTDTLVGGHLTSDEKFLLGGLLSESTTAMNVLLSDDSPTEDIVSSLSVCSKIHGKLTKANIRLKPIIGRILNIASKRKDVYESLGYKNLDKFICEYLPATTGMSRAESYACKRIAEKFPSITINDYVEIGYVNLGLLCRTTADGEPSRDRWFNEARGATVEEFKDKLVEAGIFHKDDIGRASIDIVVDKPVAREWKWFINNKAIQAYCGTADPGKILECMMAEVKVQWLATEEQEN